MNNCIIYARSQAIQKRLFLKKVNNTHIIPYYYTSIRLYYLDRMWCTKKSRIFFRYNLKVYETVSYFTRLSLDRRRGCRGGYIFFFRDIILKYTWLRKIS